MPFKFISKGSGIQHTFLLLTFVAIVTRRFLVCRDTIDARKYEHGRYVGAQSGIQPPRFSPRLVVTALGAPRRACVGFPLRSSPR